MENAFGFWLVLVVVFVVGVYAPAPCNPFRLLREWRGALANAASANRAGYRNNRAQWFVLPWVSLTGEHTIWWVWLECPQPHTCWVAHDWYPGLWKDRVHLVNAFPSCDGRPRHPRLRRFLLALSAAWAEWQWSRYALGAVLGFILGVPAFGYLSGQALLALPADVARLGLWLAAFIYGTYHIACWSGRYGRRTPPHATGIQPAPCDLVNPSTGEVVEEAIAR